MRLGQQFRFNQKCKICGHKFSAFVTAVAGPKGYVYETAEGEVFNPDPSGSTDLVYKCACGNLRRAKMVLGKYNPTKQCNDKCLSATGHHCECSCGGKNHGAGNE